MERCLSLSQFSLNATSLDLSNKGFQIGNTGAILLLTFLLHSTNIRILNVSYNSMSDDGAVAISECLKNINTLQELYISGNEVSDKGIISILLKFYKYTRE